MADVLHIGTSGWSYREWKDRFYPPECPQRRWFEHYTSIFNAVELNATFYRHFPDTTFQKWASRAPQGFEYALKVPRSISHRHDLAQGHTRLAGFCEQARLLGDHLGPLLIQLGPATRYDPQALARLLEAATPDLRLAVEWRTPDWDTPETRAVLTAAGAACVVVDSPDRHFGGAMPIPRGSLTYLRLHGREHWYRHNYDEAQLRAFADWARQCLRWGRSGVYVFFNNTDGGHAPANAQQLQYLLDVTDGQRRTG